MATYHLNMKRVKKSKGNSASAKFSYISRSNRYKDKSEDLQYIESRNMPNFAKGNEQEFWASADLYERSNACVCREIKIALPRELNLEQQKALIQEFADKHFANVPYTFAIHNDKDNHNPHSHFIFSERQLDRRTEKLSEQDFFKRCTPIKDKKTGEVKQIKGGAEKDRRFHQVGLLKEFRKDWADITNKHLAKHGIDVRIDHRTLKEQGIDRTAQARINTQDYKRIHSQLSKTQAEARQIEQELQQTKQELLNELNDPRYTANRAIERTERATTRTEQVIDRAERAIKNSLLAIDGADSKFDDYITNIQKRTNGRKAELRERNQQSHDPIREVRAREQHGGVLSRFIARCYAVIQKLQQRQQRELLEQQLDERRPLLHRYLNTAITGANIFNRDRPTYYNYALKELDYIEQHYGAYARQKIETEFADKFNQAYKSITGKNLTMKMS